MSGLELIALVQRRHADKRFCDAMRIAWLNRWGKVGHRVLSTSEVSKRQKLAEAGVLEGSSSKGNRSPQRTQYPLKEYTIKSH